MENMPYFALQEVDILPCPLTVLFNYLFLSISKHFCAWAEELISLVEHLGGMCEALVLILSNTHTHTHTHNFCDNEISQQLSVPTGAFVIFPGCPGAI
jgi:hypothetical protein